MNRRLFSKLHRWMTIVVIMGILYSIPLLSFLQKTGSYSFYENRMLAEAPVFSVSSVMDGSFFEGCEEYLSNRIYKRNRWMSAYTAAHLHLLKKSVVNDVVVAENLLLTPLTPQPPFLSYGDLGVRAADDLRRLKDKVESVGGKLVVLGVPEQYSILRDRYPFPLFNNDVNLTAIETTFFNSVAQAGIEAVNMKPYYERSSDRTLLYAKTDHHYRLEGAYLTYSVLCEKLVDLGLNIRIIKEEDFEYVELPNPFLGSRAKKLIGRSPVEEHLSIYKLKDEIPFTRCDNGVPVDASVFALPNSDEAPVEYLVYMGGDVAETVIQTSRPELPDVLLFGNSFTNALETFLYTSFNETRSLDLRLYHEMGILEYIEEYRPDVVVCLRYDLEYLLQSGNGIIE